MKEEQNIVQMVYAAKKDGDAADLLVRQYLPFIKAETAKYIKRSPMEGQDDELSIAMFAFYEAALSYEGSRGAFLPYAARGIRNRLIDYSRKELRHSKLISIHIGEGEEDEMSLMDKLDTGRDELHERVEQTAAKEEILHFAVGLSAFGLSVSDIADNCPKQERTLAACHRALAYAKQNYRIFDILLETKKLPISQLAEGAGVEKKTLERHRKYIVALLLAYTNGFEIIRGHLNQIVPRKGGQTL